jgi:hypothetical protein
MSDMHSDDELRELFGKHLPQRHLSPNEASDLQRKVLLEAGKLKRSMPSVKRSPLPFLPMNALPSDPMTRRALA